MSERLQEQLADLGQHINWPTADVSGDVLRRVGQPTRPMFPLRGWAAVAAAATAVVLVMTVPSSRSVVADMLGVVGIEVEWTDSLPATEAFDEMDLGRAVSLDEVDAGFPILIPDTDPPGLPDRTFVENGRVATVWEASSEFPAVVDADIGLLHLQFEATIDEALLTKRVAQESAVKAVTVRGHSGIWIENGPHVVTFLDGNGVERSETTRLAGNVLIWEEEGVTHRIESSLVLEDALALAESLTAP